MASIQDLIKQKQQEIQAKKGRTKTWKPVKGKNKIRVLPSWRGGEDMQFFHDFGQHFVKNSKGELEAVYLCTEKTYQRECPVCQSIGQGIKHCHDDDTLKLLKQANSSQRYLMNVLVLSEPDESKRMEPQVMEVGITVFESICEIIGEYGDITQLKGGVDLVITREGTSVQDTKYTVIPSPKSIEVPASIMAKVTNLDEYVAQENDAGRVKAIAAVNSAAGLVGASHAALAAPTKTAELGLTYQAEEAEYEDAPFEADEPTTVVVNEDASINATVTSRPTVTVSDDDLDDLLAELG